MLDECEWACYDAHVMEKNVRFFSFYFAYTTPPLTVEEVCLL